MGLFNTILEKLGIRKKEEEKPAPAPVKPAAVPVKPAAATPKPAARPNLVPDKGLKDNIVAKAEPEKVAPKAISDVDVVKKLEGLSAGSGLDWKVSIVDLLKLLDIDSSREARNELATELGCPADLMGDSAKMNTWLHKTVLKKIAENGGNIPQELLD